MEIYSSMIQRPSLLSAACAPLTTSGLSAALLPLHASVVPAAERVELPQVHQVRVQAELALTLAAAGSSHGTNGFISSTGTDSAKRTTDGASGVPPRGRPV